MKDHDHISNHPTNCILLSSVILTELKLISSAAAFKVYIALCARVKGQPISVSLREIEEATGLKKRTIIAAITALVKKKLITRIPGRGNQPNQYGMLFPRAVASPSHDTPPTPELQQATPPAATPTPATIEELIASIYRPICREERDQLKEEYPDEVVLRTKVEQWKEKGYGVAPEMTFAFLIRTLRQI